MKRWCACLLMVVARAAPVPNLPAPADAHLNLANMVSSKELPSYTTMKPRIVTTNNKKSQKVLHPDSDNAHAKNKLPPAAKLVPFTEHDADKTLVSVNRAPSAISDELKNGKKHPLEKVPAVNDDVKQINPVIEDGEDKVEIKSDDNRNQAAVVVKEDRLSTNAAMVSVAAPGKYRSPPPFAQPVLFVDDE